MTETIYKYQDVGRNYQKDLLGKWYKDLSTANEKKEPVAYLFISGNISELLEVFGFHLVYPEVNALQCGVRKVAGDFILKAEDTGYSPDVCGYVKNDIGLIINNNVGPFGKMPKPDLLLCTYSGCNTYIKWFEALAKFYDAPLFMLDVPYMWNGNIDADSIRYLTRQFSELIPLCEKISGKKFSMERLQEILGLSRKAEDLWVEILESSKRIPSPFDAFFEAVFFMAPIYVMRGKKECVDYYKMALEEIKERIAHQIGPVPKERFRVVMEGPPPWPHFRNFWELFKKWGVCCVGSTYSKVGGIWDLPLQGDVPSDKCFRHDPERPFETIAEYALNCYTNWSWDMRVRMMEKYLKDYLADGLVIHSVKSCRAFSVGQADVREYFSKKLNMPTLFIESDLADPRYFSEAQLKNRIDAFFESLAHKRGA
ncbi:MAG: hypothetical protein A2W23_00070 [Planctomycetes bacterium RBG_16_43_13]|nr:MAG: hypothetical protein A2W23_00070 [Planctomycetes bacterium RBG_16_43_13]